MSLTLFFGLIFCRKPPITPNKLQCTQCADQLCVSWMGQTREEWRQREIHLILQAARNPNLQFERGTHKHLQS